MYKIPGISSGRSAKLCDRVFPGIACTLGYFRVFQVFPGESGIYRYIGYHLFFILVMSKILRFDGSSGDLEGIHIRGI